MNLRSFVFLAALLTMTIAAAPASASTADDIVARMAAQRAGLKSYQVRVGFAIDLNAFLHLHFSPQATYYFKQPDKNAIVFDSLPPGAQQFQHFFGSIGTPETWVKTYDLSMAATSATPADTRYYLKLVPKDRTSNIDHIDVMVDKNSLGMVKEQWFYRSGASITMDQVNERVSGFVLPKEQIADFNFPAYKAHAVSDFDGYHLNADIPDSVFSR